MTQNIALITADFFEESELLVPFHILSGMGFKVEIFTPTGKPVTGKGGYSGLPAHGAIADLNPEKLDGLLIPGGFAPDLVRRDPAALALLRSCDAAGTPIGMICHGAWVAVSAGVLSGRTITAVPVVRPEVEGAGATWSDEPVVIDAHWVTAQIPRDLHAWVNSFATVVRDRDSAQDNTHATLQGAGPERSTP